MSAAQRTAPFALALAFGLALAGLPGCSREAPAAPAAPRSVRVAAAAVAPLDERLRAAGLLTAKDETRLSFKVGGIIGSMRVDEGRAVRAGEVLAELQRAEIDASLEQAQQAAAKAQRDLGRAQALFADGVATEEQVQDLTTGERIARAALQAAEFNAAHTRIVAPAGGVVLRKLAEKDEQVSAGQTVLVVGGAAGGWIVRSGLADRDAMRVHLGDLAGIEFDAWPGRTWSGRVSNIAAAADPATGTFAVEVSLEPAGGGTGVAAGFAQGLVARVSLRPRQAAPAVLVPVQALLEANEREAGILVLDRGRGTVRRVNIQIGRMSGGAVEVPGGLDAGTEVVIDGAAFLENGDPVRVVAP